MIDIFGYQGIMDGIEGSEEMIRIARTKNLYREIFLEFIDERIISTLQEGFYDICIACATFGDRTIKAARIKDMLQFMKPNSYLAIVSASYALLEPYKGATLSTMQMIANWEKQGLLKLVHTQEFPQFWANLTGTGLLLQKSSVWQSFRLLDFNTERFVNIGRDTDSHWLLKMTFFKWNLYPQKLCSYYG